MARDIREKILQYYLALRISAAASVPMALAIDKLQEPAPVVRYTPARTRSGFDRREMIQDQG
ncbi:MAG: hypothetical protein ACOC9Y_08790, partial [Chloroflexota bacterium]